MFEKEAEELILAHEKSIKEEIERLTSHENGGYEVEFQLYHSMLDGKIVDTLTETNSSQKCVICGATPSVMNNANVLERPTQEERYKYGISPLHGWIRFQECICHTSYRLPIKCWRAQCKENQAILAERQN